MSNHSLQRTAATLLLGTLLGVGAGVGLGACSRAEAPDATPQGVVQAFYEWRIRSQITGAPDERQLSEMAPYVSAELLALLATAPTAAAGKKPRSMRRAFTEGDLFSSVFDGPTTFKVQIPETQGAEQFVPVRFTSAKQLPAVNWVDRIKVVNEDGHYVVADIEYGSHWEFGARSTLSGALKNKPGAKPSRQVAKDRLAMARG